MPPSPQRGFALLVTIVLLAFLTLLLVSLATLTRVETQVASNGQNLALARQNALLGLNIALGQLQKYAGSDQAVTATADLNSNPDTGVVVANPHYTGVWNVAAVNASAKTNFPLAPTSLPDPKAPNVWLVSGNENTPLAIDYQTETADDNTFVTLVGGNTATDTVRAEKVTMSATNVPGTTGTVPVGKFAYWVGDEGVKAKFNVTDPYTTRPAADASTSAFTPSTMQAYYRKAIAQRNGIEQMTTDGTTPIGTAYAPTANTPGAAALIRDLGKVLSYPDARFATGTPQAAFKNRFWDLTTCSYGLLTDTANGGLKYDLTQDFTHPRNTANPLLKTGAILKGVPSIPASKPPQSGAIWYPSTLSDASNHLDPQWDVLRDFYQLSPSLSPSRFDSTGAVILTAGLPVGGYPRINQSVIPVFVQSRIYYGAQLNDGGTASGKVYVLFLVANPYDMPLSVPNGLNFLVSKQFGSDITMTARHNDTLYNATGTFSQFPNGGWFNCPGPLSFAAGEVKVFTLAADIINTDGSPSSTPGKLRADAQGLTNAIIFPLGSGTIATPAISGWHIKLTFPISGTTNYASYCTLQMFSNTSSQYLTTIKYIPYELPDGAAGSYTFTGPDQDKFDIGGLVFSLKMPAETGYPATQAIRFLADYNNRSQNVGSYRQDSITLYYFYYQADKDSFAQNIAPPTWGLSSSGQTGTNQNSILYHIPRAPAGVPSWAPVITSLADLQHANITTTAQEPTYAIGNSYASAFCQSERSVSVPQPDITPDGQSRTNPSWRYDMSYLCNEALWDTYYFSTIPQTSGTYNPSTDSLPNSRYIPTASSAHPLPLKQTTLTATYNAAAQNLVVNGAFNVNSTSVEAWKAVFSSLRGLDYSAGDTNLSGPFFRTLWQTGGSTDAPLGLTDNAWTGFRNLSSDEINALATRMVAQVRLRGPFRSLGDFVNRRLLTKDADPNDLRLRGALQAAIDAAKINDQFDSTGTPAMGNDVTAAYASEYSASDPSLQWMNPDNAVGNRATGAPGWLMQADVLQAIGASLSDRSDTFTIRSYGEATNPATGAVTGKAWCEVVVQRTIDYVNPSASTGNIASDVVAALRVPNTIFGRRFQIVSFRWLSPNDI